MKLRTVAQIFSVAFAIIARSALAHADGPLPVMTVNVDETNTYQTMDGYGAALTDSSAYLISHALTPAQQDAVLHDLFDTKTGIGLSFLRQPLGTSDFRTREYTFDDMPIGETDYPLAHFSIANDEEYIIPMLRKIMAINPKLKIVATTWSAPDWMKSGNRLIDDDQTYSAFADYIVDSIKAYAADGVPIYLVTPQNEPWNPDKGFHTMWLDPKDEIRIAKLLGPKLVAAGLKTKIAVWDHNWDHPEYPMAVLADPEANKYIDGVAFHAYGGDVSAQSTVHDAFPDKNIYFTEICGGSWAPEFAGNLMWDMQNIVVGAPRNWAKTVLKWNIALDPTGGPKIGGGANNVRGVITIDEKTHEVTHEEDYYALAQASKFVRTGARRIGTDQTNTVAFLNPDGSYALIAYNSSKTDLPFVVSWHGMSAQTVLPAISVETFTWKGRKDSAVAGWLTTGDQANLLARQPDIRFRDSIPPPQL